MTFNHGVEGSSPSALTKQNQSLSSSFSGPASQIHPLGKPLLSWCVVRIFRKALDLQRGIPPPTEINMSDQTKDCEACYGTGNEPRMRSVQPGRKILFHPCQACGGTGFNPPAKARIGLRANRPATTPGSSPVTPAFEGCQVPANRCQRRACQSTAARPLLGGMGGDRAGCVIAGKRDSPDLKAVPTTFSWANFRGLINGRCWGGRGLARSS